MPNEFKLSDLRSGYLVEFRNGRRAIVARAGNFTKVLVNPNSNAWWYLNSGWHDRTLNAKFMYPTNHEQTPRRGKAREWDIVRVYGLIRGTAAYGLALAIDSTSERPLLWGRTTAVKMTVSQICEKLGYDIEIIKSANKKSIGNERKIADLVGSPKMAKQKDRRANAGQIERV